MKLANLLLLSAIVAGASATLLAGPGPQFWQQQQLRSQPAPAATAPAVIASACTCSGACHGAKSS